MFETDIIIKLVAILEDMSLEAILALREKIFVLLGGSTLLVPKSLHWQL